MYKLLLLISAILLLTRCSTDFDVTADPEEQAVVYALISQKDSVHYVRIERTFLTEGNAFQAAANPDSIYFNDNITVTVTEINSNQSSTLTKIDGASVGLEKDPGIFAHNPSYLYRFQRNFQNGDSIRLLIRKENSSREWFAKTPIVQDFDILVNSSTRISLNDTYKLNWRAAKGAQVYDLILRMYFLEWDMNNPSQKAQKYVDWRVFSGHVPSGSSPVQREFEGNRFFGTLASQVESDPNKVRKIDSTNGGIELRLSAGGRALYNYQRVREAQLGLLANEFLPSYTNVEGGLGIFSSRFTKIESNLLFTRTTVDSIACGRNTKGLNFLNSNGNLCN